MADNQHNLPDQAGRHYFPETIDKTVEFVELSVESDHYGLSVRFTDKTSLTFVIQSYILTSPVYEDWTGEEVKILKQYPPIRNEIEES
jgi:hypothetical protein